MLWSASEWTKSEWSSEWEPAVTPRRVGVTRSSQTPPLVEEEVHFQNTLKSGKNKIMVVGIDGARYKNDCAGEVQQKFTGLDCATRKRREHGTVLTWMSVIILVTHYVLCAINRNNKN
jgi:hypothetical protein